MVYCKNCEFVFFKDILCRLATCVKTVTFDYGDDVLPLESYELTSVIFFCDCKFLQLLLQVDYYYEWIQTYHKHIINIS